MNKNKRSLSDIKIAIIGLESYFGLPLAVHLGRLYPIVGFDINSSESNNCSNVLTLLVSVRVIKFEMQNNFS